ncbi:MAG TPA: acyl carrier protein [Rhodopila sp.]|jgi:acyl carrier protein
MAVPLFEITAIVRRVLRDGDIELLAGTRFDDLPNWDSMDLIAVVVEAEGCYGLQFELPEIDRLKTVDDLQQMIEAKQALTPG